MRHSVGEARNQACPDGELQRWVRGVGSRRGKARYRLFCFPFAGGGASAYREFARKFPDEIEVCPVQLPGREDRLGEAPLTSLKELVDRIVPAVTAHREIPYAFFGHSMGSLISFELTRRLAQDGFPLPRQLFVSAHRAPHLEDPEPPLYDLPQDEFVENVKRFSATPDGVFLDPELREIFLPILRADFTVCDTYVYEPGRLMPCPITVLGGEGDDTVSAAELDAWRKHTSGKFSTQLFPGGHFYLRGAEEALGERVKSELIS
ncbi:thioesterase II family protein [Streptomyces yangpuensis]|uniref:thioesterase II family protein n=1 Tax=Streptomyces yangpuensis TaxID=1648182 RepID=UPI0037F3F9F2